MRITRIFVGGYREDVRFTQCCIASIRRWYPAIPITLIKDELAGAYDTSDLERHFQVEIFQTEVKRFGWGMSKLEPLFLSTRERCLIIDSDVMFLGKVLEPLEERDEDFVVASEPHPLSEIRSYYFHEEAIQRLYPSFRFPGYVFNTGQIVTNTGIFERDEFAPFVSFSEPRIELQPQTFFHDQGILNYLVLSKVQQGQLSLRREPFMKWAGRMHPREAEISKLGPDSAYPIMVHWAGPKTGGFSTVPMRYLLDFFEDEYYRVIGLQGWRRYLHEKRSDTGSFRSYLRRKLPYF